MEYTDNNRRDYMWLLTECRLVSEIGYLWIRNSTTLFRVALFIGVITPEFFRAYSNLILPGLKIKLMSLNIKPASSAFVMN